MAKPKSADHHHMRLFPRRTHLHHHHGHYFRYLEKLKKHYRWLLWLSLSLYLFLFSTTSTSSSFPHPLPLRTALPFMTNPRALSEANPISSSSSSPLKIYVYDLPTRFNKDWLANPGCGTHLFAAEVAVHEALLASPALRAVDPAEADFFFVPVYVSCNFSTPTGLPSLRHARPLLAAAVDLVSARFPFWNRSRGRDHLFVASHDFGACFHPMEDVAIADGVPDFLTNSILLQTFGVDGPHACQAADHVVIPPYVPPEITAELPDPAAAQRDIFAFFRGKMEVHPKNLSGRFYSKKVRTEIWQRYEKNPRFYLRRKRFAGYRAEIGRAVFCLCPLGWAPWSPRLVEAVALGCVPVIIADGIRLPFEGEVRWGEISVAVGERDVGSLEAVLDHVAATNLTAIQRNLWDPARRRALLFHRRGVEEGDATWQVVRELERRLLRRSLRRRRRPADAWM